MPFLQSIHQDTGRTDAMCCACYKQVLSVRHLQGIDRRAWAQACAASSAAGHASSVECGASSALGYAAHLLGVMILQL